MKHWNFKEKWNYGKISEVRNFDEKLQSKLEQIWINREKVGPLFKQFRQNFSFFVIFRQNGAAVHLCNVHCISKENSHSKVYFLSQKKM